MVWVSAKDNPPDFDLSLDQVLNAIAERTGFTGLRDLPFEHKRGEVIELLRTRRVLVIVDNLETVTNNEVYEFLIRVPRQLSQVIMTTRYRQYRSVWQVSVGGLPEAGALRKIRHEIRAKNLESLMKADDEELRQLYNITEGNPKAIELTLGYIKRTGILLAEAVSDLETATEELEEFFDYLFKYHWEVLDDPARNILLCLSFFASAARRDALQAVGGLHRRAFKQAETQLREMSLLEVADIGIDGEPRYTVHPLTRAFAGRKMRELPDLHDQFREQWISWCVGFAEDHGGNWRMYDILEQEHENLIECLEWCFRSETWKPTISLEKSLTEYFNVRGHWDARIKAGEMASKAAKALGDELAYAEVVVRAMAPALEHFRRNEQREKLCRDALSIFERFGNKRGVADATYHLGTILFSLKGYKIARPILDKSLKMWEEIGDEIGIGEVLNYLGIVCWRERKLEEGKQILERAKKYRPEGVVPHQYGSVIDNLGRIELDFGNLDSAESLLMQALNLFELVGHRYHKATARHEIARVKRQKGQIVEARHLLNMAKDAYLELGAWGRTTDIINEIFDLERDQNNLEDIRPVLAELIDLYRRLEMPKEREMMEQLLKAV